jgi:hypothetical protein
LVKGAEDARVREFRFLAERLASQVDKPCVVPRLADAQSRAGRVGECDIPRVQPEVQQIRTRIRCGSLKALTGTRICVGSAGESGGVTTKPTI